jgi:hypothetical protein
MDSEPVPQPGTPPDRRALIAGHLEALNELADAASRIDGWTPFARKLFLSTLAGTGRVKLAAEYAGLTKQSAYALRARDPVFAAGWDAACELARMPLADALYEQAVEGITETVTRDDGSTLTRHRFDSRLSIAVLNRLDKRCDRAAETGARHLGAVARWEEFVAAIGNADDAGAETILAAAQTAKQGQASQLPYSDDEDGEVAEAKDWRIWWDEDEQEWRTDFPPPPGFTGAQRGEYGCWRYSRALTAEELELTEQDYRRERQSDMTAAAADRDQYFAALAARARGEDCPAIVEQGEERASAGQRVGAAEPD